MKRTLSTSCLLLFAVFLLSGVAIAQIPRTMSYQGIANDDGSPIADGTHTVRFLIYTSATGGTPIFVEAQSVTTRGGLFSAIIGSNTPIPSAMQFDGQYWLGISIDGGPEMTPRAALTSSPYALNALNAQHANFADSARQFSSTATGFVRSLNGRTGHVYLVEGSGISITEVGDSIMITGSGSSGGGSIQQVINTDGALQITGPTGPVVRVNVVPGGITGNMIADYSIPLSKLDTAGATSGQAIIFDGSSLQFSDVSNGGGLTLPYVATVSTTDAFSILNRGNGSAGVFRIDDTANANHALRAENNAKGSWNGPAAIYGKSTANGGIGVFGEATGYLNQGIPVRGVYGRSDSGIGVYGFSETNSAIFGQANGGSASIYGVNIGSGPAGQFIIQNGQSQGIALVAGTNGSGSTLEATNDGTGRAGNFVVNNSQGSADAVRAETNGDGSAIVGRRTKTTGTAPAILGENLSTSNGAGSTTGTTGLLGVITSTSPGGWSAGVRGINNGTGGNGIGVVGYQAGSGWGVLGQSVSGAGVRATTGGGGNALMAVYTGTAASTTTADNIAIFQAPPRAGGAPVNQARIDAIGRGYFNGGTLNAGADVAELFDVEGLLTGYEPGDVLAISTDSDRTLTLASEPYSTLILGVYATKPGVLLTEEHIDADLSEMVPLGVIGVIPTKVCDENGAISRGDILVSSSRPGYAMKADPEVLKEHPGATLGKALENFNEGETGVIKVLVNVR
ncbi:MAG: hypothetical protein KDD67_10920 [Ignavibacteriae bacterium]|nr:hypothetical protein [Ignavibacteriota bacterium]MCB9215801.1 hypothetical protein [Ignavibacteria bacterium]